MPPLTHAVRLIDHKAGEQAATHECGEERPECLRATQLLRRDVEQFDGAGVVGVVAHELLPQRPRLLLVLRGVEEHASHRGGVHGVHLVLDEAQERGEHHRETGGAPGGQLVDHRLASAGRHQAEHISPVQGVLNAFQLPGSEPSMTEHLRDLGPRVFEGGWRTRGLS